MDVPNLSRAHLLQGNRSMRFEEVYEGWLERRLSQADAAQILGVCERSFRRYMARYEDGEGDLNSPSRSTFEPSIQAQGCRWRAQRPHCAVPKSLCWLERQTLSQPLPARTGSIEPSRTQLHLGQERLASGQKRSVSHQQIAFHSADSAWADEACPPLYLACVV